MVNVVYRTGRAFKTANRVVIIQANTKKIAESPGSLKVMDMAWM
jgi:hypothetical protein